MRAIADYVAEAEEIVDSLNLPGGELAGLYEPVAYGLAKGGKRIRPLLVLMCCEAFSGRCEAARHQALGIEMFHNFTLLHDDVMDNSAVRRGRPAVHVKWDVNTAILSGDTMLTLAYMQMMQTQERYMRRVLDVFNEVAIGVYEGQQFDMDFEKRDDVTLDAYLNMIRLKTSVLLGGAAKIGAIVGGANDADADALYTFAEELGLAFQIQDDFLDVYGDAATFGKPIGGDILNKKKTFPALTLSAMGDKQREALAKAFEIADCEERIRTVTQLYTDNLVGEECRRAIKLHTEKSLQALDRTSLSEETKQAFRCLTEQLINRRK